MGKRHTGLHSVMPKILITNIKMQIELIDVYVICCTEFPLVKFLSETVDCSFIPPTTNKQPYKKVFGISNRCADLSAELHIYAQINEKHEWLNMSPAVVHLL